MISTIHRTYAWSPTIPCVLKVGCVVSDTEIMKLFKRDTDKRRDREHDAAVNDRMRSVLAKDTEHEDPDTVETRLRNMNYGTSRK